MCEMSTQATHLCIVDKCVIQIHKGNPDASNQHLVRDKTKVCTKIFIRHIYMIFDKIHKSVKEVQLK